MSYNLDEIDKRVVYRLMSDARGVSAPSIAEEMNVSPGTIRNRIQQLEENGVITGYHASVDFERADGRLTNLFICTVPVSNREKLAREVLGIPGVIDVRELMTGRRNLHVTAVGTSMDDISRIARALTAFDVEIEDEDLVHEEYHRPYHPFGPETDPHNSPLTEFVSLTGNAEVLELSVEATAPVADQTLRDADEYDFFGDDVLVVAIERDGEIIMPKGETTIRPDDIVTVFSKNGRSDNIIRQFTESTTV